MVKSAFRNLIQWMKDTRVTVKHSDEAVVDGIPRDVLALVLREDGAFQSALLLVDASIRNDDGTRPPDGLFQPRRGSCPVQYRAAAPLWRGVGCSGTSL